VRWAVAVIILMIAGVVAIWPRSEPAPTPEQTTRSSPDLTQARANAGLPGCATGDQGPADLRGITAQCLGDGKPVDVAKTLQAPVLVNLWATWCEPCLREMPSLERLQQKLGDELTVAAVSQDRGGEKAVTPFLAKLGLDRVKVYLDPKSEVGKAFGVRGLPTSIVLDAEGHEVGRVEGAADWDSDKMLAVLDPLVKASAESSPKDAPR
jgi:thiol-disulfide isomerase/thioredoxin